VKDELTEAMFACERGWGVTLAAGTRTNIESHDQARERFRRVRDEIADALKGLLDALPSATTHPAITKARAALAKMGVDP